MELKRPLPPNRSLEQISNHYLVEKAIAQRLRQSDLEERQNIYTTMYDDLFRQVPDHPRITRREDHRSILRQNGTKLSLVRRFLDKSKVFVEFGPGDCRFAMEVAKYTRWVYGVDISDQRGKYEMPDNFELILYNGSNIELDENSIDIVFSDQLIEHLHPEDANNHFQLVLRILRTGGTYVFRTPHLFTGPHDISRYFSDEPEGFHLKEWTYREMKRTLKEVGYSEINFCRNRFRTPYIFLAICERVLGLFPKQSIRSIARRFTPSICGLAVK